MEKRLGRNILLMIWLICLIFVAGCGKGTEVGNPTQPQNTPDEQGPSGDLPTATAGNQTYTSATHHITCEYSSDWTATESADADPEAALSSLTSLLVTFSASGSTDKTNVEIYTLTLHSVVSNLLSYLHARFPTWTLTDFSNATLDGYMYDNPAAGSNGGDRKDYFFLQSGTLLHVITESFSSTTDESNIAITLDSLQFYSE